VFPNTFGWTFVTAGSSAFARHYSRNLFFSSGYLDVSVPLVPSIRLCVHLTVHGHAPMWVSPFRHLWLNGCTHLAKAFRSVPRLSSALDAKASSVCSGSFFLDTYSVSLQRTYHSRLDTMLAFDCLRYLSSLFLVLQRWRFLSCVFSSYSLVKVRSEVIPQRRLSIAMLKLCWRTTSRVD